MSEREWGFYLNDMITFCEKVLSYTAGLDRQGFEADEKAYDANLLSVDTYANVLPSKARRRDHAPFCNQSA